MKDGASASGVYISSHYSDPTQYEVDHPASIGRRMIHRPGTGPGHSREREPDRRSVLAS
jgi:hypothetical protein